MLCLCLKIKEDRVSLLTSLEVVSLPQAYLSLLLVSSVSDLRFGPQWRA